MDVLNIAGTSETPAVMFNGNSGTFELSGKSLPEDVKEFYNPILKWLSQYCATPQPKTVLKMRMDYFNTASSKMILEVFEILNDLHSKGNSVVIEWNYHEDDEDMQDAGSDYADMLEMPFEMKSYQ